MQPRESGSGVVRRESPIIFRWEAVRSVHRIVGEGCRDGGDAKLRQLDASKIDGVMMAPARRAWLEGAVLDAEGALGYVALEADSDRPTPEAREALFLTSWKARVASGPHLPDSSNARGRGLFLPGYTKGC